MNRLFFFSLILWPSVSLCAHEVDQHFLKLTLNEDHASGRLEMDAGYALPEIRDPRDDTLPTGAWLDALSDSERERLVAEGQKYLQSVLHFQIGEDKLPPDISFAKWGTDWPMYFDQRPDTFARMVWDVHINYDDHSGDLELFWNEKAEGPSLALQTVADDRELALITVSQGEEHTLSMTGTENEQSVPTEPENPFNSWLPALVVAILATGGGLVWRFFR